MLDKLFRKKPPAINTHQDFWDWFVQHEKRFFRILANQRNIERDFFERDFFDLLGPQLDQLRKEIWYAAGMQSEDVAELILTPDGDLKNIAFIEQLVATAPQLPNWKFTALKPPLDIENVNIAMGDLEFRKDNLRFYANEDSSYPDEIDITIVHTEADPSRHEQFVNGTFIFLDNYLGELHSVTLLDNVEVVALADADGDLIPIEKLKDYLLWRQKEFVEKYEGMRRNTEQDTYHSLEARLENDFPLFAIVNSDLLRWDGKASHPWMMVVEISYHSDNNGMPDKATYRLLDEIEDQIVTQLKDVDGYLNLGRQTAGGSREIYFACKEFRAPSRVMDKIVNNYEDKISIGYDLFKDKYWRSMERFNPPPV